MKKNFYAFKFLPVKIIPVILFFELITYLVKFSGRISDYESF